MFNCGVIVVSDTCYKDKSQDKSGSALSAKLYESGIASDVVLDFVPDEALLIQQSIMNFVSKSVNLIITTGGTGFSPRDVTPEAVKKLLEKEAPGIVIQMMTTSLAITNKAALGRPVAGTIKNSLVVTLPGSVKGSIENLESIIPLLPHCLKLLSGESSRDLHSSSGKSGHKSCHGYGKHTHGGHSHGNHSHSGHSGHGGHDGPKFFGVASRERKSPYEMLDFDLAVDKVLNSIKTDRQVTKVDLKDAVGYVLSEDIHAESDVPRFRASIVDGYAVNHNTFRNADSLELNVAGASLASSKIGSVEDCDTSCFRITTGAPLPANTTAVVPVENTKLVASQDEVEMVVEVTAPGIKDGDNVREIGSDVKKGTLVLQKGTVLGNFGGEIGVLASLGINSVPVYRKPIVGVMSTGDEVVNVGSELTYTCIWDSNRLMIISNLREWLPETNVVDLGIVKDVQSTLEAKIRDSLASVDILVTSGGVSMGETDFLKPTIQRLGGELVFGRVNMKPGKPMTFATMKDNKFIFALPGNPVSCVVCLTLFARPFIMKFMGRNDNLGKWVEVEAGETIHLDFRPEFQRGVIRQDTSKNGAWVWYSTGFQRSSFIKSMVNTNCLAKLPGATESKKTINAGEKFKALLM